jgi:hypothetical protein
MRHALHLLLVLIALFATPELSLAQAPKPNTPFSTANTVQLSQLLTAIHEKAKSLENSPNMRQAFLAFTAAHHLSPESIRYSDFVLIRLLFESTRDAGFWNLHWNITDQPPNSDSIWRQWRTMDKPSLADPTATAECDELSALYAFLVERSGVKSVGLFWPYSNHTVAVWTVQPANAQPIRVVVPTTQIFLEETDLFDTKKFNPWRQKTIYEYTRRDVSDTFQLPKPLADFFLQQIDKYAGASDSTLQHVRYLRDAVINRKLTPDQAAHQAEALLAALPANSPDDASALKTFADDMRLEPFVTEDSLRARSTRFFWF